MHEREGDRAAEVLDEAEREDAFVVGVAGDADIAALESAGLFVEVLGPAAPSAAPAPIAEGPPAAFPRSFRAKLRSPLTSTHQAELAASGARLVHRTETGELLLSVENLPQLEKLAGLELLEGLLPDSGREPAVQRRVRSLPTAPGATSAGVTPATPADDPALAFDVRVQDRADLPSVVAWVQGRPGTVVVGQSRSKLRAIMRTSVAAELAGRVLPRTVFEGAVRSLGDGHRYGGQPRAPG